MNYFSRTKEESINGMVAAVNKDVGDFDVVVGYPAKLIRRKTDKKVFKY